MRRCKHIKQCAFPSAPLVMLTAQPLYNARVRNTKRLSVDKAE